MNEVLRERHNCAAERIGSPFPALICSSVLGCDVVWFGRYVSKEPATYSTGAKNPKIQLKFSSTKPSYDPYAALHNTIASSPHFF